MKQSNVAMPGAMTIFASEGKKQSHRPGLYYCNHCKGQFTVTVGTEFERSKIPPTKWWMAVYLLNSSKKGFSAHQLHRTLNAWRLASTMGNVRCLP
jgi:transposase-like protein